ncbi:carbamoyltransferase [Myxococcota bacterium]|nr:carbamoyltransferase [Myxococcota bacterium]
MIILGIADNHDSGAALIRDGRMVAAVGQERIDRRKNSSAFPWGAIDEVLRIAGIRPEEVDRIACASHFTPATALRRFRGLHQRAKEGAGQFSYALNAYIAYQVALRETGLYVVESDLSRELLAASLRERGFRGEVRMVEHHECHAYSAYRSQPHDDALAITVDAMGDGTSVTVSAGEGGDLRLRYRQSGFSSINTYYSRVTEYLGFKAVRHEGKITGLAAYAEPPEELLAHFREQMRFVGPGFNRTNYLRRQSRQDRFFSVLGRYSREQVAAALQRNLEEQVCALVAWWVHETGRPHLALAGGTFANVKLNQRILALPGVGDLFVYPNMGDGGLAAGAALAVSDVGPERLGDVYLGADHTERECEEALRAAGLAFERPGDLPARIAELLVGRRVVARHAGRMEWGPRALGNRTILYRPDDPSINDWLNKRLRRTEFMPFAPVTLWEHRGACYRDLAGGEDAARFMTVCFDCTDEMKRLAPGVVHIDGTARPQLLRREDNPEYHRIVEEFHARTGIPAVINTSFNMHEEPIVRTPSDAVRAFIDGALDHLALGPFLVEHPGRT